MTVSHFCAGRHHQHLMHHHPPNADSTKPCRRFKWLRIAASAVCWVLCLTSAMLWIRSSWYDHILVGLNIGGRMPVLATSPRNTHFAIIDEQTGQAFGLSTWSADSSNTKDWHDPSRFELSHEVSLGWNLCVPHWFLVLLFATIGTLPWLPWHRFRRFSLKALLIATAIISAVLGLGVWLIRG
jgi:hypothetical protein